jgi:predicted nucleic acid-binding protein
VVLADTSIWIDHLRKGESSLGSLLLETEVVCHPYIIGELACGHLKNRDEILRLLESLPCAPVISADEFFFFINEHRLMGVGIGFVDVHLLASALLSNLRLWTGDRRLQSAANELGVSFV